jgi:endoglucanase
VISRRVLALLALAACAINARAEIEYRGINLSAAAFGHYSDTDPAMNNLPGVYGIDYKYPDPGYFDYFHDLGMNTFRIPFRWERIQPTPGGALNLVELALLEATVNYATNLGANVVLDLHNYGRFITSTDVKVLGTPELPNTDLADLWTKLGTEFANREGVIFGLMNEPHDMTTENVVDFTNLALTAIRGTGANNLVLVEGNGFSGGHSWLDNWYGTSNATAMLGIAADANLAFEVHQYVDNNPGTDADYSGTTDNVESPTIAAEKLVGFTDWLRANNLRGFLGEIGTPDSPLGTQAMFNGINFVENNADVWLGWTLWSGGPWWDNGDDDRYLLSLNPYEDGTPAAQIFALEPFLNSVPEPATWSLCALGGGILLASRRFHRKRPTD